MVKPYQSSAHSKLLLMSIKNNCKKAEATKTLAKHCSVLACDHIGETCNDVSSDSTAATWVKMPRNC